MQRSVMFSVLSLSLGAMAGRLMEEAGEGGVGSAPVAKTSIRPDLTGYTNAKSASGANTKICGDEVSLALVGATLDETYGFVAKVIETPEADLRAKYSARNLGQQRMFLGNLIRGAFAGKDQERAAKVRANLSANLSAFRTVVDSRVAGEAQAKADEKAAKKAASDKVKAEAKAKREAEAKEKKDVADKAKAELQAKKDADKPKAEAKPATPAKPAAAKAPTAPVKPQ